MVITGAGSKSFCAGGDMLEMSGLEKTSAELPEPSERTDAVTEIARAEIPVIAAVNGYCYGGGVRLAIECDLRFASTTSTYRFPGAEYGLVVAASTLPRLVGAAKAKEWIFTARKIEAEEALRDGLVNQLYEPEALMPAVLEMAATIASHSMGALRESKRVIDEATLDAEATAMERSANRDLRGSDEQTARFRSATKKVTGR